MSTWEAEEATFKAGAQALMRRLGLNPEAPGLAETPDRMLRAFVEFCTPDPRTPAQLLARQFEEPGKLDSIVFVGPVEFVSLCEHHFLPFTGKAWVAYKPEGNAVVGLSKLPRLVKHYAARPQVQERLTEQVTGALMTHLDTTGAACLIRAEHTCTTLRGVRAAGSAMVTSSLLGIFRDKPETRNEFLTLVEMNP